MKKLSPEELLERLIEEDQEHTENTRYILAVMLERKKLLRETDNQQTPNGILRVYEHRKSGEVYLVRDPNIPLEEVERVQAEVFALLDNNGRLPEPEEVAESDPETGSSPQAATEGLSDDSESSSESDSESHSDSDSDSESGSATTPQDTEQQEVQGEEIEGTKEA